MTKIGSKSNIVRLNVGGIQYEISRGTLERCKGSMLASLISDKWKEGNSDDNEPIFIDRNGRLFEYVLDYLRTNEVCLKKFEFYGLDADMRKVHEWLGMEYTQALTKKIAAAKNELDLFKAENNRNPDISLGLVQPQFKTYFVTGRKI